MIRLVRVELTRLRRRRAVVVLMLMALVAPALILAGVLWETRPASEADLQRARAQIEREMASRDFERTLTECAANPEDWGVEAEAGDVDQACLKANRPRLEWYGVRVPLRLGDQLPTGSLEVVLSTALLMLAATTFIGHDWNSGSMSNQLIFEPRRQRVFWAKAFAVVLLALLASALALAVFWGGLGIATVVRDLPVQDQAVRTILNQSGRGVVFAAAAALGAYAITNLFRSTVFTLGLMFAVFVVGGIAITFLPFPDHERFQMATNLEAWIAGKSRYWREVGEACWQSSGTGQDSAAGLDCRQFGWVSWWEAAQYFGALLLLALGLSSWSFHRRDVP